MPDNFSCQAAAFSADSKTLMLSKEGKMNCIQAIDTKTFLLTKEWDISALFLARSIVCSTDGKHVFIGCSKGVVDRLTIESGNITTLYEPVKKDGYTNVLLLSPDGSKLIVEVAEDYSHHSYLLNTNQGS